MVSSAASAILRLAGWSYIPDFATAQCLRLFHHLTLTVFHRTPPPPRTDAYLKQYRITFAGVVIVFLLYNLVEAMRTMTPNLYELLGVHPNADDNALKAAFRAFARKYHPDRVGQEGEALFIEVRDAFEALKDPVRRFAYDRFGPDALMWTHCTTVREYVRHGLMQSSGFHIVSSVSLLFLSAIGRSSLVAFWRYLLLLGLFASELAFLLGPSPAPPSSTRFLFLSDPSSTSSTDILSFLFPRRLPYQHILFLHQLFIFLSVALSRVAPVLFPSSLEEMAWKDERVWSSVFERLRNTVKVLHREVTVMLDHELATLRAPSLQVGRTQGPLPQQVDEMVELLTKEMENMIIEHRLRKEAEAGPLRTVWETAIKRGLSRIARNDPIVEQTSGSGSGAEPPNLPSHPGSIAPVESLQPKAEDSETALGIGRLPSPRPSPEPSVLSSSPRHPQRQASYNRGRSVSC